MVKRAFRVVWEPANGFFVQEARGHYCEIAPLWRTVREWDNFPEARGDLMNRIAIAMEAGDEVALPATLQRNGDECQTEEKGNQPEPCVSLSSCAETAAHL